ncbi:hypothetical protein LSAT2_009550 [Lamellibrachia satsuma]|nr:hypothetical protein LSAT2_009550 [Lamellibrachia satsuma]
MKKENRKIGFDGEAVAVKVKKKKRKKVEPGECDEQTAPEHSVDISPDKKRMKRTDKDKVKKSDKNAVAATFKSEEEKKIGASEAAAKRKMREKKRAKRAAKKARKVEQKAKTESNEADAKAETLALEYLQQWCNNREEWSFQKVRQVWLLQHLYDTDKMSVANFALMLKYIDGLKGNARSLTVTKAEELLITADSSDEEEEKDDSKKQPEGKQLTEEQEERARAVLQMLN